MLRSDAEWYAQLSRQAPATDPAAGAALADLRALLLRALRFGLANSGVTESDLEDFVQDGILKIIQELPSYRGEARFTTWAQKVCVRVALTELRRRRWRDVSLDDLAAAGEAMGRTPPALMDHTADPAQVAAADAAVALVHRIIAEELTSLQRTAMTAVMEGGMPLQEVADRLGTNRNALYKLLHDARRRLQQRLVTEGVTPQELLAMFDEA
jgi:RNA polymerase sigma-70 factor (ECF subfamily)